MYIERGKTLRGGHDFNAVHIHVGRALIEPQSGVGNVLRRERVGVFIQLGGAFIIAFKTHIGKFRTAHQAWFNIADTHTCAVQIGA